MKLHLHAVLCATQARQCRTHTSALPSACCSDQCTCCTSPQRYSGTGSCRTQPQKPNLEYRRPTFHAAVTTDSMQPLPSQALGLRRTLRSAA